MIENILNWYNSLSPEFVSLLWIGLGIILSIIVFVITGSFLLAIITSCLVPAWNLIIISTKFTDTGMNQILPIWLTVLWLLTAIVFIMS